MRVRHADFTTPRARLRLVGESAAGHAFEGALKPGECVRIFTGARVPAGADTILLQEDADRRERVDPRQRQPRAGPSHPREGGRFFDWRRRRCGRGRGSGRRKSRSPPPPITPSFPSRAVLASRSWPAVTNWSSQGRALVPTGSSAATISRWPASSNRPAASRSISASAGTTSPISNAGSRAPARPAPTCW